MKFIFNDKRRYARIVDKIKLNYIPVSEEDFQQGFEHCAILLADHIEQHDSALIIDEINNSLNAIFSEHETTHKRIQSHLEHLKTLANDNYVTVDLSAGGMALVQSVPFQAEQRLIMTFQLEPSHAEITTFARVIRVLEPKGDFSVPSYELKLEFEELSEDDRVLLTEHVTSMVEQYRDKRHHS